MAAGAAWGAFACRCPRRGEDRRGGTPNANGGRCCHQPPLFLPLASPRRRRLPDRFRPRPFGLGRFRRFPFRPKASGAAMRFPCPKAPVPPRFLRPKALVPCRALEESGFGPRPAFAFRALRASSLNTLTSRFCRCFGSCEPPPLPPRWQWLAACVPFPVRRVPGHTNKLAGPAESDKAIRPVDK